MQPPRGTRDFGPSEMAARRDLERRLRDVLRTFNYREVQTPTFEELELFLAKSGPGVRDEIYEFKDKSGRELCLRPELTAPVMRFYFSELRMEPKPLRLYYFGPCYRYDKPQAGRYREFWQLGAEVVGDASPEGHAELLWMALRLFQEAGLEQIVLRIGHLDVLRSLIETLLGVPMAQQGPLMRFIDKKDMTGLRQALEGRGTGPGFESFEAFFAVESVAEARRRFAGDERTQAAYAHLERILALLGRFGADLGKVRFDPTIARGLEYYSGLVFELDCPALGAQKQLLGGGVYDLSGVFQAEPVATVGFGMGFDRTLDALRAVGQPAPPPIGPDAYVAALSAATVDAAQRLSNGLREAGLIVELDLAGRGPRKALERAAAHKARHAVLVGERELQKGVLAVKRLASGEQSEVLEADLVARLKAL